MLGNRLAGLGIVDVGGDVELQQLGVLFYDVLGSTIFLLFSQPIVGFDDVCQLMRQVILRPISQYGDLVA